MQAGLLRDKIIFLRNDPTRDAYGGSSDNWVEVFMKRAYVKFDNGSRKEIAGEIINTTFNTFTIRYNKDVTPQMRIRYEGFKYRIISINRDRIQQSTVIKAELINE